MITISRRNALGVGAAGLVSLKVGAANAQTAVAPLKAVVTLNGQNYEFREEVGGIGSALHEAVLGARGGGGGQQKPRDPG